MGVITNPLVLWGMGVLETLAYRTADACVGLAPGIVDGIRRKVPNKRVVMIPNGSDLEGSAVSEERPGKLRCIFAGAHGIANGLDAVLDAAAELKRRNDDSIAFVFVGAGMLKAALKRRALEQKLDNCEFLDPMPKHVLHRLQTQMDVGLMILRDVPAFYNGTSPNKFFDYLACGLPVLINYPGWLAQLVSQQKCGISVAPRDAGAFADALQSLARSADQRREMGRRSRALAEGVFSRDLLGRQFVDFLESVADGKAAV
jgi:glycosyltransferase involved in cell wall biosynthesis